MKKLIVVEFEVKKEYNFPAPEVGLKYSYFKDPETGKYYRPKDTFTVTGDNLEELFVEV